MQAAVRTLELERPSRFKSENSNFKNRPQKFMQTTVGKQGQLYYKIDRYARLVKAFFTQATIIVA
jgi:hypothetical protein